MTSLALRMNSRLHRLLALFSRQSSGPFGGPRCSHNITPKKMLKMNRSFELPTSRWLGPHIDYSLPARMVNSPALDPYSVWTSLLPYAGK